MQKKFIVYCTNINVESEYKTVVCDCKCVCL